MELPLLQSLVQCILLALAVYAMALPSSAGRTWDGALWKSHSRAKALYVMTNDVNSNAIVTMSVGHKGKLSGGSLTPTGGKGGNVLDADGKPHFPDSLSAQDSVVITGGVSHDYLFAVNAGSNTLSMFVVSPSNPLKLKLLGQPQYTGGSFPVSVAASSTLQIVCVANQGLPSGVSCAKFSGEGLSPFDALRPVNVGTTQNPPFGPVPGVGDILFTADQSSLLLMVKGNDFMNGTLAGFIGQFAIQNGAVATAGTLTTPPGTAALFGTALVPGSPNMIFASDATFGAVTLNINNLAAPPSAKVTVAGQLASCWAGISKVTGTGFITDIAVNRLVEADFHSGTIITEYYPPNPFSGMSDISIRGGYLWTLSAGNGSEPASITTFDISGCPGTVKQASIYAIPGAGVNTMGMAII